MTTIKLYVIYISCIYPKIHHGAIMVSYISKTFSIFRFCQIYKTWKDSNIKIKYSSVLLLISYEMMIKPSWSNELAQHLNTLAAKFGGLSSISKSYMTEGKTRSHKLTSTNVRWVSAHASHTQTWTHRHTHMHTHTHEKIYFSNFNLIIKIF